ncbi:MAG: hypothetical protein EXS55_03290 [Candidatus Magasanikbacteria bacterium]|nr:hypothetical protein [Candidatus Magasanikbacteria bacterium]
MVEFSDEPTPVDQPAPVDATVAHNNATARARRLKEITDLYGDNLAKKRELLQRLQTDPKFQKWFVEDVVGIAEQEKLLADANDLLSNQIEHQLPINGSL